MKLPKGLSLLQASFIISIVALLLTLYSSFEYHPVIKQQEIHLTFIEKSRLYLIRFIHYFIGIFTYFYLFFVEIVFIREIVYLICYFLLGLHWIYFKECILSIAEKRLLDNTYLGGDNTEYEPFRTLIHMPLNGKLRSDISIILISLLRIVYAVQNKQY